ncbi:MAG: HEPN domain-containing protein [Isosphaeraceae bacterium]
MRASHVSASTVDIMDKQRLKKLAEIRLKDAQALLGRKRWSGAYYLSGYVIECALKACLPKHLGESDSIE